MGEFVTLTDIPYGNHERHKADIFIPENVKSSCGIILFIHGGGWSDGDKTAHTRDCEYFADQGYITATMNYRFVSENINVFNELDDITKALETIKRECAQRGYNIEKLILSGGSAGAHLALLYAYTRKEVSPVKPVAVCAYCPPVSCHKADFLLGISGEFEDWKYGVLSDCCGFKLTKNDFLNSPQQEALLNISPEKYVAEECIPTAVFHGKVDELIPIGHIYDFIDLLNEKGIKNDFVVYENSGHALDKDPETALKTKDKIISYAQKYF